MNNKIFNDVADALASKKTVVGVVGLGYVGLPLVNAALSAGFSVRGIDIDEEKLRLLSLGVSYLEHVSIEKIISAISADTIDFFSEPSRINECDVIILCLPTPLNGHREPDLTFVLSSLESMIPYLREGQIIILESTTYPGTTEEKLWPIIKTSNLVLGESVFLGYSPEREDPGNKSFSLNEIPKVVSGVSNECLELTTLFYKQLGCRTVPVSSTKVAEMTKILENTYRSVNIALVNELKVLAHLMDVDIFEVIDAASTKPFGFQAFYPGPGLGGHCIPIDPFYLTWKAREYNFHTRFIELAGEINTSMPDYVIQKIQEGLNGVSKSIKGAKILILGVAYKKNMGDVRESPGIEILNKLMKMGAEVSFHDPFVSCIPKMRKYDISMVSTPMSDDVVESVDVCVIVADHDDLNYEQINRAKLVVDTRGRMNEYVGSNVIRA